MTIPSKLEQLCVDYIYTHIERGRKIHILSVGRYTDVYYICIFLFSGRNESNKIQNLIHYGFSLDRSLTYYAHMHRAFWQQHKLGFSFQILHSVFNWKCSVREECSLSIQTKHFDRFVVGVNNSCYFLYIMPSFDICPIPVLLLQLQYIRKTI